jgi:predicted amidophosphoribosyltransferase
VPMNSKRFCSACGTEIAGGARFCSNCAAPVARG